MGKAWWVAVAAVALLGCNNEGAKVLGELEQARVEHAKLDARAFADAYQMWMMKNGRGCPGSIDALFEYANRKDARDPWGNDYVLVCGDSAPAGVEGAGVRSNGPDGKPGTGDDVTSW